MKKFLPDLIAILAFIILSFAYFFPADIEGRILFQHDTAAGVGAGQESKEYLERCRKEIRKELSVRGLTFNEKKTRIFKVTDGFVFLGFKYRLTETGKVIKTIDPKNVKERRRMLRKLVRKAKRGELTRKMVDESYYSWRAHAKKGHCFKLLERMDKYYKSLWR